MTYTIWASIANTPWWIFAFFLYLIWIGAAATTPRIVSFRSLFILPSLFLLLSFAAMTATVKLDLLHFLSWQVCVVFGIGLGYLQCRLLKMKALKNERALYIPGTYSLLILLAVIFILKFYSGFDLGFLPSFLLHGDHSQWLVGAYGLGMGLFIGQFLYAFRCLKNGPYHTA